MIVFLHKHMALYMYTMRKYKFGSNYENNFNETIYNELNKIATNLGDGIEVDDNEGDPWIGLSFYYKDIDVYIEFNDIENTITFDCDNMTNQTIDTIIFLKRKLNFLFQLK